MGQTFEAVGRVPRSATASPDLTDYPVREYVGAMASELAQMARWDGDETLAAALQVAADLAARPAPRAEPVASQPAPSRPPRS